MSANLLSKATHGRLADAAIERLFLNVADSLQNRKWLTRATLEQQGTAERLIAHHDIPPYLAQVLASRGVTCETIDDALQPSIKKLMPDPSSLTDMDRLTQRLARAFFNKEKIALFGDYDVDGACSVALMLRYLRLLGHDALFHIPDRIMEGYGPNIAALESFKQRGVTLVITLDCGTTSFEAFTAAQKMGLDILVIDHHLADVELPATCGLVNPNRQDDLSRLGYLCAAGVTFMVLVAMNRVLREAGAFKNGLREPDLFSLLDLVALATVCDVVPLTELNRAFVHRGLERIRARENIGLRALADAARLNGAADTYHLGFMLGPRINAGGRIGEAALGTTLLTTDDDAVAMRIAQQLDTLNQERQIIEQAALEEAKAQAENVLLTQGDVSVMIVGAAGWHPGIVGLIAARIKEQFNRPAFALAYDGDKGTGSGRSIPGVDLGRAVRGAVNEGTLVKGGGHAMAAGITIERIKLADFSTYMEKNCGDDAEKARANRSLQIDGLLNPSAITAELVQSLQKAGPFGAGCPEPVFAIANVKLLYLDVVAEKHLRLTCVASDGTRLKVMAFRAAGQELGDNLSRVKGEALNIAVNLSLDSWQGRQSVSLRLVDAAQVMAV